tara:strand:+ start:3436 stop:3768 length:333 start_codon:yes stop_codon:yes gene_type:complete
MKVGEIFSENDLDLLPTINVGRKPLLEDKTEWMNAMESAKHDWIVLESEELTPKNVSRLRNRVTRMNKQSHALGYSYEFTTRSSTSDNVIAFLGKKNKNTLRPKIVRLVK